jgi:hypothetical protein
MRLGGTVMKGPPLHLRSDGPNEPCIGVPGIADRRAISVPDVLTRCEAPMDSTQRNCRADVLHSHVSITLDFAHISPARRTPLRLAGQAQRSPPTASRWAVPARGKRVVSHISDLRNGLALCRVNLLNREIAVQKKLSNEQSRLCDCREAWPRDR